jgi:restriction system protein
VISSPCFTGAEIEAKVVPALGLEIVPHLFLWRDRVRLSAAYCAPEDCPFCGVPLMPKRGYLGPESDHQCDLCGWKGFRRVKWDLDKPIIDPCLPDDFSYQLALRQFDISDTRVALDELGTHLKRCFSDIYQLDARRFEEIVCDVLRRHGNVATLTQVARDGGVDIFLFKPDKVEAWCIVECKRYAEHRKVGIQVIDRLAGVQLAFGIKRAKIITTSDFSRPAVARTRLSHSGQSGFTMDLVGATELLRLLDVYSAKIPPLEKLTLALIRELISENRQSGNR